MYFADFNATISAFLFLLNWTIGCVCVIRFFSLVQTKFHMRSQKVYHCSCFIHTMKEQTFVFRNKTTRVRTLQANPDAKKNYPGHSFIVMRSQKLRGLFHFIISRWFHFLKRQNQQEIASRCGCFSLLCYCCIALNGVRCRYVSYNTLNVSINLHIERETRGMSAMSLFCSLG